MTTLAVVRGWGDDPEAALPLLREALERARELGLLEEWWRAVRQHGGRARAPRAARPRPSR